jgi:hypothetical protein
MSIIIETDAPNVGKGILAQVRRWEECRQDALIKGDVSALKAILDLDASFIHSDGMVDSAETFIETVRNGNLRYDGIEMHVFRMKTLGARVLILSGAVVTERSVYGKRQRLDELFSMAWLMRPEGWKLSSYQATALATSLLL